MANVKGRIMNTINERKVPGLTVVILEVSIGLPIKGVRLMNPQQRFKELKWRKRLHMRKQLNKLMPEKIW